MCVTGAADRVLYVPECGCDHSRDMLLLNEARHCHGNTALCSQPDAKPLNYIFLAESTSIAFGLQSNGTVGAPDASPSSPTFQQNPRGDKGGDVAGTLTHLVLGRV